MLRKSLVTACVLSLLSSACGTQQIKTADNRDSSVSPAPASEREGPLLPNEKSAAPNVLDLDLSDVPEEYRHTVLKWIEFYQGRGRGHMVRYLSRSTRFIPMFKEILKKHNMPEDLVYLALIESGYTLRARSHASAVGPWQFIPGTGKRYGLEINRWVDERQDPVKSTEAAALYLKALYNLFGSWYLAISSYNVGEMRIQRSVMKYYTRSFWELAHRRVLPRETIEYIPKFIAAGVIARHPAKYGFTEIPFLPPMEFEEYSSPQAVDLKKLAAELNFDYNELADMNAMYKTRYAIVRGGSALVRIPKGSREKVETVIAKCFTKINNRSVAGSGGVYRVRPGDSLYSIARKFGTTIEVLKDMNDIKRGSLIRIGMRLSVPDKGSNQRKSGGNGGGTKGKKKANKQGNLKDKQVRTKASSSKVSKASKVLNTKVPKSKTTTKTSDTKIHVVKPGDTLIQIARKYGVSMGRLVSENKLPKAGKVLVGRALIIPE